MPTQKSKKVKLYIVIGLLVVAVIVAYFRFIHKKNGADADIASLSHKEARFDVSHLEKTKNKKNIRKLRVPVNECLSINIRDIFSPVQLPAESASLIQTDKTPEPIGILELKGIIIGGKKPMAIINDKFVRTGEKIGEYQIVKIDPNEVLLKSVSHEMVLQVLTPADKQ
jgi:hypothetical protein